MINIYVSNRTDCEGYKIASKIISVPYYNPYINSELCLEYKDYSFCQSNVNVTLSEEEFQKGIKEYINNLKTEEEPIDIEEEEFNIIDFILEYKYFFIAGGVTVVVLVGIILIARRKKDKGIL